MRKGDDYDNLCFPGYKLMLSCQLIPCVLLICLLIFAATVNCQAFKIFTSLKYLLFIAQCQFWHLLGTTKSYVHAFFVAYSVSELHK